MRIPVIFFAVLATGLASTTAVAQHVDVKGAKDHPLVSRYSGAVILRHEASQFDEYLLPLGPSQGRGNEVKPGKSTRLSGAVTRITYLAPAGRSTLEVIRNYELELKNAGYQVVFAGAGAALGNDTVFPNNFASAYGYKDIKLGLYDFTNIMSQDNRFMAARLARPQGDIHVVVYATTVQDLFTNFVLPDVGPKRAIYQLDIIEAAPMATRMVTLDAAAMAASFASTGSVALYGITFDTGRDEVKPESTATLEQIAALLKSQPSLNLLVVGHTDNVGTFEANLDLSQRRAAAVVRTLTSKYSVDAKRLTPLGVSFASPVAPNTTEDGRSKNRRVQLVPR